MKFKNEIEKLIDSNIKTYRDNSNRFIADYNRELELTKDYNGRQLLELLQNADDAGSDEVSIVWDKVNSKLILSNKGEPFEAGGIKSLMLANLSTKTKVNYIGNKGLGFRSILNWAEQIDIKSNNCIISFSEKIATDVFENQLSLSDENKKQIRTERNLSDTAVPFPVLAIPIVKEESAKSNWATSIEITYRKNFEEDIESQLAEISEEILLFLNNIQKIIIQIGQETLELQSEKKAMKGFESVTIKAKNWKVFSRENILPLEHQDKSKNETQSYSLKVAFQDDLSDDYRKLFNYFPTQISILLPCIAHGTFELNSNRNHLNESKKNEYILKELVQLLKDCSLFLTKQNVDWRPYKLISPSSSTSDSKLIEVFYKDLENLKQTERIYPCINSEYNPLENAVYYNDEFNGFFFEHFPNELPELLIPLKQELFGDFKDDIYNHEFLVEKIDMLSESNMSVELRAELITQLAKVIPFKDEQQRFSLLVNESGHIIPKEDLAFTPVVRSEERFHIPKSVKVDFMKSGLYDLLISKFEAGFDKREPKSRELQRTIKSIVNLQPYDSNNVIEKIITGTKDSFKSLNDIKDKIVCVKEMVAALYGNFKNLENKQDKLPNSVPLISGSNELCNADDLYLSETYPSGELTQIIYEDLLKENEYLARVDFWEMENADINSIESFFLWLGVNKHSKITKISLQGNWGEKAYLEFIFNNGTDQPDNFEIARILKDSFVSKLEQFEEIQKLSVNKLILLTLKDDSIRRLLESNDERINWYYVTWRPAILSSCSYIRFQFLNANLFSKYVIEEGGEDLNRLINEGFQIDYNFLESHGINKSEVKSIILKLGAKESFTDISPENVYEILRTIPAKDRSKKGKATQTIYKMALESLVKQQSDFTIPEDILYFSRKSGNEDYRPRKDVYYADNAILPKKVMDELPILNLPKRIGEDNVEKYFGVRSLREFKIQINERSIQYNSCDTEVSKFIESLKPFILAYRLNSPNLKRRISDIETKRKESRTLKQFKIHIVTQCRFSFGDNQETTIDDKEFINVKDIFYFKESCLKTLEGLRRDSLFCDAFAEMMCIIFKVNDLKNDFRQILKNDIQDTNHLANQDLDKEKVEEAYQLLGLSRVEVDFWKNVFSLKNKQLSEPIETIDILKKKIKNDLLFNVFDKYEKIDFETFSNRESYELICSLCGNLKLSVKQLVPMGLYNWHKQNFISAIKDSEHEFKQLLWQYLSINSEAQGTFISVLNKYSLEFIFHLENEILNHQYELVVEYTEILKKRIKNDFNIDMEVVLTHEIEIRNLYEKLLSKYSIEEVDMSDLMIRSLLFFEGNTGLIDKYLIEQFTSGEITDSDNGDEILIGYLVDASLSKNEKSLHALMGNGRGSWVHSGRGDKGKKRKGKKSELLVYNTLVEKYGVENVKWVSGNSTTPDKNDKLHYDIEYKNEAADWKYLEVKSISENQFIISSAEANYGVNEPDRFEMALVSDDTIYLVKDIFKFKPGETFENNSKFTPYAKDYIFVFDFDSITK